MQQVQDINKHIVELYICDVLDSIWFYIWNKDGEFDEVWYLDVVDGIYDALQEYRPAIPLQYIRWYIKKEYPYNIW